MATLSISEVYKKKVIPAMKERFGYANVMAVPKITKVVVNIGVGRLRDEKEREEVKKFLRLITGQEPSARPAKKAIAAFKTREGLVIGYRVTLRGKRMEDFISRLINIALPRTRDFRGLNPSACDNKGNLTIGIKEYIVFPEMIGEDYRFLFGLEATIVTTAKKRDEGMELLRLIGFPIKKNDEE